MMIEIVGLCGGILVAFSIPIILICKDAAKKRRDRRASLVVRECFRLLVCPKCAHRLTFYPSSTSYRSQPGYRCQGGCDKWFDEPAESIALRVLEAVRQARAAELERSIEEALAGEERL